MKVTRRAIAQMLAATAAAAPQQTASDDPARRAREQFGKNAQAMGAVKIPIATEPAVRFKA